ncbi:AGE family epimerase/isomerase [Halomicrobium urmianum]|uniref:AGE family epimerase/isomerase n=1 Tax=Halomicrobium urmianum TaxID=1586233 RepID=UPI001CD96807|nr:AGE family epimerase/isomerase [Halomicrobium urmianum]
MIDRHGSIARDPRWLREHARTLLSFYFHRSIDHTHGGYVAQISDVDGTVYDSRAKLLPATCRFVFNFSVGTMLSGPDWCESAAVHGMDHLERHHLDREHGGYAWVLDGSDVEDGAKRCYGHAFALLAYSTAARAGIEGAAERIEPAFDLIDEHFWEDEHGLCRVELERDWSETSGYRGQNANMHTCEALLSAYEATGDDRYLDRAYSIAETLARDLTDRGDGLLWEHYDGDWEHDWEYNRDKPGDLFRPWGYQPGHLLEWAKLLLLLDEHRDEDWLAERADRFFDAAVESGWDDERGGFVYNFDRDGEPIVENKYYWPLCEGIGATALLYDRFGEGRYAEWYDRIWEYALDEVVNEKYGNWYFQLTPDNEVARDAIDDSPEVKVGYHQLNAIFETLRASGYVEA